MKILVTGCLGFVGSNLVPALLKNGHTVEGFDNFSNSAKDATSRMKANSGPAWQKFRFYNLDVTSFKFMHSVCANESPIDVIIHLAATGSVPRSFESPRMVMENNVLGFVSICQLAHALEISRLVFASSSSVYGNIAGLCTEGRSNEMLSPYAISKKMNEDFARTWLSVHNIKYIGLRFFNVYGPGQRADGPYAAAIPRLISMQEPTVYGDGNQRRDFTYVDDVCYGILCAVMNTNVESFVCNLAKGESNSINEILNILKKKAVYLPKRGGDIENSRADVDYLFAKLGYIPHTSIAEGLEKTISYY